MPLIIPPGHAHVIVPLKHAALARAAAITVGVEAEVDTTPAALADILQTRFATYLNGLCDSEVTIGPVTVRQTPDGGGEPVVGVATSTAQGGRSGDSQVPNVALLVHKVTGRGGRRGRGRFFIPWGLSESEVNDVGALTPAAIAKVNTAGEALLTGLAGSNIFLKVLHNSDGITPPGEPNVIQQLRCDARVGTMRKRMGR